MAKRKIKLSKISTFHYIRLTYRSVLFILLTVAIFRDMILGRPDMITLAKKPAILIVVWIVFMIDMCVRFFPSSIESPGCQKQFAMNYKYSGNPDIHIEENHATVLIVFIWIAFNSIFGILHMLGILSNDLMLLIASAYSVCDMICILFFCPFQIWLLKNKCCATCRIYNWDYAMMFTPLLFVKNFYALSLFVMGIVLMGRWEITYYLHPERFSEKTNSYLECKNCKEKLCHHKRQLLSLPRLNMNNLKDRIKLISIKKEKK